MLNWITLITVLCAVTLDTGKPPHTLPSLRLMGMCVHENLLEYEIHLNNNCTVFFNKKVFSITVQKI